MDRTQALHELAVDTVKISPPAGVVALHMAGFHLPDVVAVLTIVYLVLQIVHRIATWKPEHDETARDNSKVGSPDWLREPVARPNSRQVREQGEAWKDAEG